MEKRSERTSESECFEFIDKVLDSILLNWNIEGKLWNILENFEGFIKSGEIWFRSNLKNTRNKKFKSKKKSKILSRSKMKPRDARARQTDTNDHVTKCVRRRRRCRCSCRRQALRNQPAANVATQKSWPLDFFFLSAGLWATAASQNAFDDVNDDDDDDCVSVGVGRPKNLPSIWQGCPFPATPIVVRSSQDEDRQSLAHLVKQENVATKGGFLKSESKILSSDSFRDNLVRRQMD